MLCHICPPESTNLISSNLWKSFYDEVTLNFRSFAKFILLEVDVKLDTFFVFVLLRLILFVCSQYSRQSILQGSLIE